MVGLLSGLNWAMSGLLVCVGIIPFFLPIPLSAALLICFLTLLLAAPHAYLGLVVEKGEGRTLQTVLAVIELFNFPIGTALGVFSLWVVWSVERERFDYPVDPRDAEVDQQAAETVEELYARSPWDHACALKAQGLRPNEIRNRLKVRGLDADEIETLIRASSR